MMILIINNNNLSLIVLNDPDSFIALYHLMHGLGSRNSRKT